jgi:GNAT superfamily N-acetyltransferase
MLFVAFTLSRSHQTGSSPARLHLVYTEPRYRGKGVGKSLTERAIIHLKTAGCTDVVLHASDAGAPMYEKLGFTRAGEMRLAL